MQRGDRDAVEAFYRRYLGALWRFVLSRLHREADAKDVVSETFLAAIGGISSADPDAPAIKWLIGIAKHKLADHFRRRNIKLEVLREAADPSPDAAERVQRNERREKTLDALNQLDDEQRTVLEWKYIEGLSVKQIASQLGKTEKSVESTLFRARNTLREALHGAFKRAEP